MRTFVKIIIWGTIALSFIIALIFYLNPGFPEIVASHWNVKGEVDGYLPKFWALFLTPIISLVMGILFEIVPLIDPHKENFKHFRKYYDAFIALVLLFFLYLELFIIGWNIGVRPNITKVLLPAMAILFYCAGLLVEHAKQNWFVGIRTPWTLSSLAVWDKTHRLGGKLFKACGLITLAGLFLPPETGFWLVIGPIILSSLAIFVYSYFIYRQKDNSVR